MADIVQIRATSESLMIPRSFIRRESYASYLQKFVADLVAETVPLSKKGSKEGRSAPWWTAKAADTVRAERRARRQRAHPDHLSRPGYARRRPYETPR